jgi:hypothetical protein
MQVIEFRTLVQALFFIAVRSVGRIQTVELPPIGRGRGISPNQFSDDFENLPGNII